MSLEQNSTNGTTPRRMQERRLTDIPGLSGAIAGLGGGLAMIVVAAMLSVALGFDMWREPREIAAPIFGLVTANDTLAVMVGTLLHFLMSALLGSIFEIVSLKVLRLPTDYGVSAVSGLIYGLVLWAGAYFVVLPLLNPVLLGTYAPSFVIQNLVYGVVTGVLYGMLRPTPYATGDRPWPAVPDRV